LNISNTKLSDPQTKPDRKISNTGRNKYANLTSPLSPPIIEGWRHALQSVDTNPLRRVSDARLSNSGYALPDPGLFLGVTTTEKQARFFVNWLKYRSALLYRLVAGSGAKPIGNQMWRTLLSLPLEQEVKSQPPSTKSASRRELIRTLLEEASKMADIELNSAPSNTVFWHEHEVHPERIPERRVAQEILWELHELNFRFEFLALDHYAHDPTMSKEGKSREDMILACFPGRGGDSILVADTSLAHLGLAAEKWQERAQHVLAMRDVMQSWKGFDNAHLSVGKEYGEREIVVMETALAKFYAQSFFDFFGRAAILPHRLPKDESRPA
jgi:hypothetical protein